MLFSKTDNVYKIARITGAQNNILGIEFMTDDDFNNKIEVIECNLWNMGRSKIKGSKEEILKQVLEGLKRINQRLGTKYKFSRIYFSPFDLPYNKVYACLTIYLITHYHTGETFKETSKTSFSPEIIDNEIFTINYKNYIS